MKKLYIIVIIILTLGNVLLFIQNKKLTAGIQGNKVYVWVKTTGGEVRPHETTNPLQCFANRADCLYRDENGLLQELDTEY